MEKNFGPNFFFFFFFLKKDLKVKKKLGHIIKHFRPYLLGALGDGLSGLAIGPALNSSSPFLLALAIVIGHRQGWTSLGGQILKFLEATNVSLKFFKILKFTPKI
jgi:hypothetical protein